MATSIKNSTLKYDFMPSLQNITRAKIVSSLWMKLKIRNEIKELFKYYMTNYMDFWQIESETSYNLQTSSIIWDFDEQWHQIEEEVFAIASQLCLPGITINTKLKSIIKSFGKAIYFWILRLDDIFESRNGSEYFAVDYIDYVKWDYRGTIDYQLTARSILKKVDNGLNNDHRYKLACAYCLEDEIAFAATNVITKDYLSSVWIDKHPMVYFWTAHVTGIDYIREENISRNEHVLQLLTGFNVCERVNEVAVQHVWNKLSKEEKARNLIKPVRILEEDVCSFLSNLNYELQTEVFKLKYLHHVLYTILDHWSYVEYFLPTTLHALDVMQPKCYIRTLKLVKDEIIERNGEMYGYVYNNRYKSIFKQLWEEAPKNLKDFVLKSTNERELQNFILLLYK